MPSHHRCCNPVVLFSNHSFQLAVLRYLRSFGCRGFSVKTNGSPPTRSPRRKNSGWGFLRRLLATPGTHLPVQLPQFRHSAQKHIVACNRIVIRLHPPRHFTSAAAFHFRRGYSLPPWKIAVVLPCVVLPWVSVVLPWVRWVLPWIAVVFVSSLGLVVIFVSAVTLMGHRILLPWVFLLPRGYFFCRDSCGPP